MPFGFFKNKDNVDYKARLERKMCVAKEAPEVIFDLSECNLKNVPSGVFSLCRVLRKEALFLQCNNLINITGGGILKDLNLIKVLDLHSNKITNLPKDMNQLENLEDLNVSFNCLTCLPDGLGQLKCLKKINLRCNKLKYLPKSLGQCRMLISIDLRENTQLYKLPLEFAGLVSLKELLVDPVLKYPDNGVISKGVDATIAFLQSEGGDAWNEEIVPLKPDTKMDTDFFLIQEKLKMIEQRKDDERSKRLAWEKTLIEENEREISIHEMKNSKKQLVEDIKKLQNGVEEELKKIQKLKDVERSQLILECLETEERLNNKVGLILDNARKFQTRIAEMTDRERIMEDEILFQVYQKNQNVEKTLILDAMNELVKEELLKAEKFQKYDNQRQEIARNRINEESEFSIKMANLVENAQINSQNLTDALMLNDQLQKAAVASLMAQSDTRSWNLAQQVSAIETQLAELTRIEIARKKMEQDGRMVELSASRLALTELLLDLFAQQKERRTQIIQALERMESARDNNESFWLEQYQRLLDSNSRQLVKNLKNIDVDLHFELVNNGVAHYLPILADCISNMLDVTTITNEELLELGIADDNDRLILLTTLKTYKKDVLPSAPPLQNIASAPPLPPDKIFLSNISNECVVCMENTVDAIFLPCGHLCCCCNCARLEICPICRAIVQQVFQTNIYQ